MSTLSHVKLSYTWDVFLGFFSLANINYLSNPAWISCCFNYFSFRGYYNIWWRSSPLPFSLLPLSFSLLFYFILLYYTVLVLPFINMNPPRVYTCSQSWTPLPPFLTFFLGGGSSCIFSFLGWTWNLLIKFQKRNLFGFLIGLHWIAN